MKFWHRKNKQHGPSGHQEKVGAPMQKTVVGGNPQRAGMPVRQSLSITPTSAHTGIGLDAANIPARRDQGLGSAGHNLGNGMWSSPYSTSIFRSRG